jgi:hypothetical protein
VELSVDGIKGVINPANRTVTVTVPLGTNLTSLVPVIEHSGVSVSPASGAAQNFYRSGYTPVSYTVTAADGSKAVWTLRVRLAPLDTSGGVETAVDDYLSTASEAGTASDPVLLPVDIDLANTSGNGWTDLLDAIESAGEYVDLDLSASTMTGTEFDPGTAVDGMKKIVSLVLPDEATEIKAGSNTDPYDGAFKDFTALTSVEGAGVTSVGGFAFSGCTSLETVKLPALTSLGTNTFYDCTGLTEVSLPASLSSIGANPFTGCTSLESITVDPGNPYFKHSADKKALLSKDGTTLIAYPSANGDLSGDPTLAGITVVGNSAFEKTAITAVHLPAAVSIDIQTFEGCDALTTVSLPAAASIGMYAFYGCPVLTTVDLPAAEFINQSAFASTGTQSLTVTLGSTPPTLGTDMFRYINSAKTVTVKVPSGAAAWDSIVSGSPYSGASATNSWGNGFRGKGWDGSATIDSGGVNGNITLTIEELP